MCGEKMTGKAFLKRLALQLDFLNETDRETVLDFYRTKINSADTLVEEEKIVGAFGIPETIAKKLKEAYFTADPPEEEESLSAPENEEEVLSQKEAALPEEAPDQDSSAAENQADAEDSFLSSEAETKPESESEACVQTDFSSEKETTADLDFSEEENAEAQEEEVIFSKTLNPEKAPEVIHSLENKESKPLYGEKVIIEERKEPIETFELDPIDEENHLTAEEIQEAKAVTLEKAEKYSVDAFGEDDDSDSKSESESEEPKAKKPISIEKAESEEPKKEKKQITGLFTKMFANSNMPKGLIVFCKVLLSILFSPLLIATSLGLIALYTVGALSLVGISLLMVIFILGLIAFAVIEIIHALVLFFDRISIALIEIGLATVLFGIVCALAALIYEFLFAVFPKAFKKFTVFFARSMKNLFACLYGGNA